MRNVRIAGIGAWHVHAKDFMTRIMNYSGAEVAAVWDSDNVRGKRWAQELGCVYEADIDALLSDESVDAVTITCETTLHYAIIVKAAKAGKHIYVEKPPFLTAGEAYQAKKIIEANHVKFMIGSPIVKPMHLKTMEMIQAGMLGKIVSIRYRTVHELALLGTQKESFFQRDANGGGVMMDMGNHALHLLSWFAGAPKKTEAIYTSYTDKAASYGVDDNDIAALEFENGILGTVETGWVTPWYQYGFDLYGTKGCVSCRAYEMYVCLEDGIWRKIPEEELPKAEIYPLNYWIDCIRNDRPIERDGIDVAVLMTEMSDEVEKAAKKQLSPAKFLISDIENADLPELETARHIVASGCMGEVLNIRVHCCGKESLDVLTSKAKKILFSFLGKPLGEKIIINSSEPKEEQCAVALLQFENKRLGIAEACSNTPEYERSLDICGTHGWLRIRGNQVSYTETEPGNRNAVWHTAAADDEEGQN